MANRLTLSPEAGRGGEAKYWATFSDVALSMLLVLVLFILAQFVQYERVFVFEEIGRRMQEVAERIESVAAPYEGVEVEVFKEDDMHQRIRVAGALVFEPCRANLTDKGRRLLIDLGRALSATGPYFESVEVEGHADRLAATGEVCRREGIEDNWQLSSRRATEVVRLFSGEDFFPGAELSSVGRGAFHPLSSPSDTTAADLRKDRRIEIVLRYSDQGIGKDGPGG